MDLPIVVTEPVRQRLDPRPLEDYTEYKTEVLSWLAKLGKNPKQREGYATSTVRNVTYKTDMFCGVE
jgi:hypothetical protein